MTPRSFARRVASHLPAPAKRSIRRRSAALTRLARRPLRRPLLDGAVAELRRCAPDPPPDEVLEQLVRGWDNDAAGDLDYLRAVIELCRAADGPILECGSGLTTICLAAYASEPVWTLEADERWFDRIRSELDRAGLDGATLVHAPLRDHGDIHWYELPAGLPSSFSMVVCDGPAAGGLRGGRVGLMAMVGERLRTGAPVVVDRGMVYEAVAVETWERDHGLLVEDERTAHRVYRVP